MNCVPAPFDLSVVCLTTDAMPSNRNGRPIAGSAHALPDTAVRRSIPRRRRLGVTQTVDRIDMLESAWKAPLRARLGRMKPNRWKGRAKNLGKTTLVDHASRLRRGHPSALPLRPLRPVIELLLDRQLEHSDAAEDFPIVWQPFAVMVRTDRTRAYILPTRPASSNASLAATSLGRSPSMGQPFGMTQRCVSREVMRRTCNVPDSILKGRAANCSPVSSPSPGRLMLANFRFPLAGRWFLSAHQSTGYYVRQVGYTPLAAPLAVNAANCRDGMPALSTSVLRRALFARCRSETGAPAAGRRQSARLRTPGGSGPRCCL